MSEELIEEGIVLRKDDKIAEVALMAGDGCEECSAKLFCSSKPDNSKVLRAVDPFGVQPGDKVTVSLQGSSLLGLSVMLYGVPLFLLVATIITIYYSFIDVNLIEAKAFFGGLVITGIYFLFVYFGIKKIKSEKFLPKITFVRKII